jgi:uncharacterized protein
MLALRIMLPVVPNVEIRDTGPLKGRGVFAAREFQTGEVVEICAAIVFRCPFDDLPRELQEVAFCWSGLAGLSEPHMQAIALGYGGLYNSKNPANMRYEAVAGAPHPLLRFIAVRTIQSGEELTVNYSAIGGGPESDESNDNRWFEKKNITYVD